MCGKSPTCRLLTFLIKGLRPAFAVIDRQIKGGLTGKSETCRASAWPSHCEVCSDFVDRFGARPWSANYFCGNNGAPGCGAGGGANLISSR